MRHAAAAGRRTATGAWRGASAGSSAAGSTAVTAGHAIGDGASVGSARA